MSERAQLRADKPVGEALAAVARHNIAGAVAVLDDRRRSETTAVHDLRKALKRWRALLRLLESDLGDEAQTLRLEARDLARSLASAREPRSALDALADLGDPPEGLSPRTHATIKDRLEDLRRAGEAATLTDDARQRLCTALARVEKRIERWPLDHIDGPAIAARLTDTYRRVRRAMPQDWSAASPEELHELRQRVVAHRYQMELIEPWWPKLGKVWVGEAQKLRERLGSYQDLVVLAGFTAANAPLAHWRARLAPAIAAQQKAHLAAAKRIAGRLFAEKPRAFRRRITALWAGGAASASRRSFQ